jgi:hypothetical protein
VAGWLLTQLVPGSFLGRHHAHTWLTCIAPCRQGCLQASPGGSTITAVVPPVQPLRQLCGVQQDMVVGTMPWTSAVVHAQLA